MFDARGQRQTRWRHRPDRDPGPPDPGSGAPATGAADRVTVAEVARTLDEMERILSGWLVHLDTEGVPAGAMAELAGLSAELSEAVRGLIVTWSAALADRATSTPGTPVPPDGRRGGRDR